jgi:hypothetical protein
VNNTAYAGRGAETEDDIVWLRRRKLGYESDAAVGGGRTKLRTRRMRSLLARATPAVFDRWPWQR